MKRYDTKDVSILIRTNFTNDHAGISVDFRDSKGNSEKFISMPAEIVKQKINDTALLKHIMNFFIKD